jgi:hypothetical protein
MYEFCFAKGVLLYSNFWQGRACFARAWSAWLFCVHFFELVVKGDGVEAFGG